MHACSRITLRLSCCHGAKACQSERAFRVSSLMTLLQLIAFYCQKEKGRRMKSLSFKTVIIIDTALPIFAREGQKLSLIFVKNSEWGQRRGEREWEVRRMGNCSQNVK